MAMVVDTLKLVGGGEIDYTLDLPLSMLVLVLLVGFVGRGFWHSKISCDISITPLSSVAATFS